MLDTWECTSGLPGLLHEVAALLAELVRQEPMGIR